MQIILKHWTEQNIKSPAKPVNAPLIEKCTNVVKYKGRKDQIKEIMNKITINSYKTMKDRVRQMSSDDEFVVQLISLNYLKIWNQQMTNGLMI